MNCGRRGVHAAHEMVWDSGHVIWCPGKKTLREEVEQLRTERDWWDSEGRKMNRRIVALENDLARAESVVAAIRDLLVQVEHAMANDINHRSTLAAVRAALEEPQP